MVILIILIFISKASKGQNPKLAQHTSTTLINRLYPKSWIKLNFANNSFSHEDNGYDENEVNNIESDV